MIEENRSKEQKMIMIVDDVEANRVVLKNIIAEIGHRPVLAENGVQALKMMERIRPHLLLLDIAMPVKPAKCTGRCWTADRKKRSSGLPDGMIIWRFSP